MAGLVLFSQKFNLIIHGFIQRSIIHSVHTYTKLLCSFQFPFTPSPENYDHHISQNGGYFSFYSNREHLPPQSAYDKNICLERGRGAIHSNKIILNDPEYDLENY